MKFFITGIAGFIAYHLAKRLAQNEQDIVGIDNVNDYYGVDLKYGRLADLGFPFDISADKPLASKTYPNIRFVKMDLADTSALKTLFEAERFDTVIHFAAQAGVRYSLKNPNAYIASNVQGFLNILESVRTYPVQHLVYASSSSIYGLNTVQPFSETQDCNHPTSLYAVSKKTNELMAHTYAHLYGIPSTGLRFFTVYGPWGRPDMAPMLFAKSILANKPITVFNYGNMQRDFTYIDDIIESIVRILPLQPQNETVPAKIYNIGNGKSVALMDFIHTLERALNIKAKIEYAPMQPGDVPATWSDCSTLEHDTNYRPDTDIRKGVSQFVSWYRSFYCKNKE
ncbi:NAD-dependent epimerase/dehydratase family protein [Treponema endosymbiont of Eucomonympha sp.]|uniref:NAD-dependent epimerase/dehydratase family protein n=1 Tax=Treponema endosymbiont of Eucomonympha sp. TaxID=1580831 RepID=UPI000751755F|nr:NAD-dependent epimerase/dehydratase family protein [Treponema endosymbiont of Eucomonympha sp.]